MNQDPFPEQRAPGATRVLVVDPRQPEPASIAAAATVLRQGGLVAFPTETVYGLGAHALDPQAVARVFEAKGRPATNPIIVHVAEASAARDLATEWPETAERLAAAFWPGPLTLVLPKTGAVPALVAAGGSTVGLRVPAHPVALALLREAGLPVAAPSANRSNRVSPTTARHVLEDLEGRVDLVLDAGPTAVGLESTVIDLTGREPVILRPGHLRADQLAAACGHPVRYRGAGSLVATGPERSPGQLPRHYAPAVPLDLVPHPSRPAVVAALAAGQRVGWVLAWDDLPDSAAGLLDEPLATALTSGRLVVETLGATPDRYAHHLYAALHRAERAGVERIIVERPGDGDAWRAVVDRLTRAARPG